MGQIVRDEQGRPVMYPDGWRPDSGQPAALSDKPAPPKPTPPPPDRHILTLAQAASLLGLGDDESELGRAADLLVRRSVPRVVGWARRDVEDLARSLGAPQGS